jgi:periplasmic protein TonB
MPGEVCMSAPQFFSAPVAARTSPWTFGTSVLINGAIVTALILIGLQHRIHLDPTALPGDMKLGTFILTAPPMRDAAHGGGGGGSNSLIDPITGRMPKFEKIPLTPPQIPVLDHPQLAIQPAIAVPEQIKLPDNPNMPNLGVYRSANVTLITEGPGANAGIGWGHNGGVGPGNGNGAGDGADRGAGGGIYTPGGDVSAPVPIVSPEADFSDEARRAKFQGVCVISLIVDTQGNPVNPRVTRRLGMGLDEKALEAVSHYRFKPARKNGKPVPVRIAVAVNFRLY